MPRPRSSFRGRSAVFDEIRAMIGHNDVTSMSFTFTQRVEPGAFRETLERLAWRDQSHCRG